MCLQGEQLIEPGTVDKLLDFQCVPRVQGSITGVQDGRPDDGVQHGSDNSNPTELSDDYARFKTPEASVDIEFDSGKCQTFSASGHGIGLDIKQNLIVNQDIYLATLFLPSKASSPY
jgi:hypothetical protein